ncbi:MAG: response regulator transcription factor [Chitinophagaceae bacterium]|nr:MAG: response regulator transcription factor [Chitinophagaceae bacterium]
MNKSITCIVTDDEPMARKGLEGYIRKIPSLQLLATCEDALALRKVLETQKPDLLFLDIEMPQLSGIDLLKSLHDPPKVILTTAYEEFALEGFELDVIDYLLKPVSFERFTKAVDKAIDYFQSRSASEAIFIKVNGCLEKVLIADVLFVEALENYVAFHTTKHGKLVTHATLKSVITSLPSLFQTHKSFLVNIKKITAIRGANVLLGSTEVPLSKSKMGNLKMALSTQGIMLNP